MQIQSLGRDVTAVAVLHFPAPARDPRDAEVPNLVRAVARHEHVVRLDVQVQDAVRVAVRQTRRDVARQAPHVALGDEARHGLARTAFFFFFFSLERVFRVPVPVVRPQPVQARPEAAALAELHLREEVPVLLPRAVVLHDVLVERQVRHRLHLVQAPRALRAGPERRRGALHAVARAAHLRTHQPRLARGGLAQQTAELEVVVERESPLRRRRGGADRGGQSFGIFRRRCIARRRRRRRRRRSHLGTDDRRCALGLAVMVVRA